jgi:hypothetical protein
MTGKLLGKLGMDPAAGKVRDERVPQAVEVGHTASVVTIVDAGRCEVRPEHPHDGARMGHRGE